MTLVFRIEMLPARHGDCLLITYGTAAQPHTVLVDCGPLASYPALRTRLSLLNPQASNELLIVTHIDHDHIGGSVPLLAEQSPYRHWDELWFNGWEQLRQPLRGWRRGPQAASGQRSVLEGHHLARRIHRAEGTANATFGGRAICIDTQGELPEVTLQGGLRLTLLSPDVRALELLRTHWSRGAAQLGVDPDDPAAVKRRLDADRRYRGGEGGAASPAHLLQDLSAMTSKLDEGVTNGSSIAFVAEFNGKRCALLADAHMPLIESSIRRLAKQLNEPRLRLDAVKVSHHGSKANMTKGFMQAIDCERFLVSTDGSVFGHPDDEAIVRIIEGARKPAAIYFNYLSPRNERWRDNDLQEASCYRANYPADGEDGLCVDLLGEDLQPVPCPAPSALPGQALKRLLDPLQG